MSLETWLAFFAPLGHQPVPRRGRHCLNVMRPAIRFLARLLERHRPATGPGPANRHCGCRPVGAILAASSTAFYAIKWFGVAYLIYLAVKQWRALPADLSDDAAVRPIGKPLALVFRGFLVNVSNPKALVFMLAVLPQFVNPHAPLLSQYLILGTTMICVDLIVMAGYTGLASKVLRLLRTPKQQRRLNRTFAGLFVGAAGFLATLHRATT
jgi:homoserine/homoserine lactone efflux protein